MCCNCFNPFSTKQFAITTSATRSVDLLSATPCWSYETRPPFHAKRRLSAWCLELIYNLTFHLPESRHFTSLQLHFMTDQTDLLKVEHTHTHIRTLVLAHPLCSHAHPLPTHSGHTVRPYQSHYKFNVRPFCAASARPQFQ